MKLVTNSYSTATGSGQTGQRISDDAFLNLLLNGKVPAVLEDEKLPAAAEASFRAH
jgi:hypothetical protein